MRKEGNIVRAISRNVKNSTFYWIRSGRQHDSQSSARTTASVYQVNSGTPQHLITQQYSQSFEQLKLQHKQKILLLFSSSSFCSEGLRCGCGWHGLVPTGVLDLFVVCPSPSSRAVQPVGKGEKRFYRLLVATPPGHLPQHSLVILHLTSFTLLFLFIFVLNQRGFYNRLFTTNHTAFSVNGNQFYYSLKGELEFSCRIGWILGFSPHSRHAINTQEM